MTGDEVEIVKNLTGDKKLPGFCHGQKGKVIAETKTMCKVQLKDEKKFPVPYYFFKEELAVLNV
jgi:hypothetical protein